MQSGRRFFITGWRSADALAAFEERLARAANGVLTAVATPGSKRWLFAPQDDGDVVLARGLCAEYDVALCLRVHPIGAPMPGCGPQPDPAVAMGQGGGQGGSQDAAITDALTDPSRASRPTLVVDPAGLQALKRYGEGAQAVWRAQAGCTLGALADAGLTQFAGKPAQMTLAQWACGRHDDVGAGETALTGVVGADVLFADGTVETLGGFGAKDTRALKSPRVQAMVPALFELARSEAACLLRAQPRWLGDARLDALVPAPSQGADDINVARVFLGHQGRYGWILQWLLRVPAAYAHDPAASTGLTEAQPSTRSAEPAQPARPADAAPSTRVVEPAPWTGPAEGLLPAGSTRAASRALAASAHRLNEAVSQVLDPENRYGGATVVA